MSWLSLLLIVKTVATGLIVALPFLLLPKPKLERMTNVSAPISVFFRLYGVAITALLVGYSFGIPIAENSHMPWGVIWMGTVSNGGAAIIPSASNAGRHNQALGVFFGIFAVALATTMLVPMAALQKAW